MTLPTQATTSTPQSLQEIEKCSLSLSLSLSLPRNDLLFVVLVETGGGRRMPAHQRPQAQVTVSQTDSM
jgi:hypothetical protein